MSISEIDRVEYKNFLTNSDLRITELKNYCDRKITTKLNNDSINLKSSCCDSLNTNKNHVNDLGKAAPRSESPDSDEDFFNIAKEPFSYQHQ